MRRSQFESRQIEDIRSILNQCEVGHLGILVSDGYPRVVPVNFVRLDDKGSIAFHCAMAGEKWEALQGEPKVTFNAYIPYSIIPSYWLSDKQGCGASHLYKSIQINGRVVVVKEPIRKAELLQALMEKYQPEGRYATITADDPKYVKSIAETGVVVIEPELLTCKIKMGSNLPRHTREKLIVELEKRGEPIDILTANDIRSKMEKTD